MLHAVVCGAVNVDYLASPYGVFRPGDSNPGRVQVQVGGVGHNMAAALCAMGCEVKLAAALGEGPVQAVIRADAKKIGLDLSLCRELAGQRCGTYLCVNDEHGNVTAAVADMEICDQVTPAFFEPILPQLNQADVVLTEANLQPETLLWLGQNVRVRLCADCVSVEKAIHLTPVLPMLYAIKANAGEAQRFTGCDTSSRQGIEQAARILLDDGVKNVFLSLGAEGCYYASREDTGFLPIIPGKIVNTNGCGDVFMAAAVCALAQGNGIRQASELALAAASLNAEYAGTISHELTTEAITARLNQAGVR